MRKTEIEKGKCFNATESIDYESETTQTKTIIGRTTGDVTLFSLDTGEIIKEKTVPFDIFIQVIDGEAEVIISNKSIHVSVGQAIIIPAHSKNMIKANVRNKLIYTLIKSGYEDM